MHTFPRYTVRTVHTLDGMWDFAFLGSTEDPRQVDPAGVEFVERMPVPGCFDTMPGYEGVRGTVVYRTTVRTTPGRKGLLTFGGLGMWSRVFVDGVPLAETALPYSEARLEVPASDRTVREVTVVNDNRFDTERVPLLEQFFDFYAYGGIFRTVRWHELPETSIDRTEIRILDAEAGRVRVTLILRGTIPGRLPIRVVPDTGRGIAIEAEPVGDRLEFEVTVPTPTLWSPACPALHTLRIEIPGDDIVERFGLRTVSAEDGKILINGEPIKLLGYCRHEAHPQYGPALPDVQLAQDIRILRRLGCNFVRGSHYPQDPRFLDLCNEAGLVVFEESMGWGQSPAHFVSEAFRAGQLAQTEAMVRKSFNHPSVCFFGFLNEGQSQTPESRPLYTELAGAIRSFDSGRLVTYACNHPFDDINLDLVDVISVNTYPGWYARDRNMVSPLAEIVPHIRDILASLDRRNLGDKPFMLTEIGAGAIYGWRDPLEAHWSEEYQANYLDVVCRETRENPRIVGLAIWQLFDCRTYASSMALGRPRAFNNKGSFDEYRRPKMAAAVVRKAFTGDN